MMGRCLTRTRRSLISSIESGLLIFVRRLKTYCKLFFAEERSSIFINSSNLKNNSRGSAGAMSLNNNQINIIQIRKSNINVQGRENHYSSKLSSPHLIRKMKIWLNLSSVYLFDCFSSSVSASGPNFSIIISLISLVQNSNEQSILL